MFQHKTKMEKPSVIDAVEKLLSQSPKSARDFLRALKTDGTMSEEGKKKAINSALYTLLKAGKAEKIDSTPPLWTKPKPVATNSGSEEENFQESIMAIFIDITNSPCHEFALKYAQKSTPMYIFVNDQYPAKVPEGSKFVYVGVSAPDEKVTSEMLVRMTTFVCAMNAIQRPAKIVIVSTSSAFNGIERMLKATSSKIEVEVIKDGWDSLKLLLE